MSEHTLVLSNVRLPVARPAHALAIVDGRIRAVGGAAEVRSAVGPHAEALDCGGRRVTPGLHDAHTHLFALADDRLGVDCGPAHVRSFAQLRARLAGAAAGLPPGRWLRGFGYDDFYLAERAHPDRQVLDAAVPDRPVVLFHRSRHLAVLNGAALRGAGIGPDTAGPPDGLIERDAAGTPTGRLFEMAGWLAHRLPAPHPDERRAALRAVLDEYLALGVTAVQDASPGNGLPRWQILRALADAAPTPRITMLLGYAHLEAARAAGLTFGAGDARLRLGHVKLMVHGTTGSLQPPPEELAARVRAAHAAGFPVAVHTIDLAPLRAILDALEGEEGARTRPDPLPAGAGIGDRLEHVSICPPAEQARIAARRLGVVSQPNFIYESGERYRAQLPPGEVRWLYPTGGLLRRGVVVAAGSDAPVADPDPRPGLYAAVTRRSRAGTLLSPWHAVTRRQALALYTTTAARLAGRAHELGRLAPGYLADLVVWEDDPFAVPDEGLLGARVYAVVLGGDIIRSPLAVRSPRL